MLANVFAKTLRDQRHSLIGWSIGTALTVVIMAAIWPSFSDMDLDSLLSQYPEAMKEAFNITGMTTGTGYINAELFSLMLPAMFIIFAVARGARLIAGEEEDGTLDLLATMPVSRGRVLLEKGAALVLSIGVLALVLLVSTYLSSLAFGLDIPFVHALNGALAMCFIGLEFGLVALALSACPGSRALATGVTAGLAGAAYLLYLIAQLIDSLRPLRVLSPFYQAISEGPIGPNLPPITLAMLVVGLVALVVAVPVFERRDLAV
ncbi:MAG: ABC transporter permease subunit [Acidimicrobiales bacterium]